MNDGRLNNLEELTAHMERQIHDLNEMVTNQWEEIDRLKRKINHLNLFRYNQSLYRYEPM